VPVHFVLDHNFPWLAVRGLQWPPILRITPLVDVDRRLVANHDDWQVLIRLAQRGDVDGFITNDAGMLEEVREMVALRETSLTLVITDGVGHDPIRATGLLMLFLEQIARQVTARPTIYRLRPGRLGDARTSPNVEIDRLARRANVQPNRLISEERRLIAAFRGQAS
jgi:hypothetical protein